MKIIKRGNVPKATATCPVCGCEFEYEPRDVEIDYANCSCTTYPPIYNKLFVRCPECGKQIDSALKPNWI